MKKEEKCECNKDCTCEENCSCGEECNCSSDCTCDECHCSDECTCGENCECTPEDNCTQYLSMGMGIKELKGQFRKLMIHLIAQVINCFLCNGSHHQPLDIGKNGTGYI